MSMALVQLALLQMSQTGMQLQQWLHLVGHAC
jgi:hypothetical protein